MSITISCHDAEGISDTNDNADLQDDIAAFAKMSKALGHPARVQLLNYLNTHETCYFGKLTDVLPLAASTISQHITILKEAGLIMGHAEENRVCYCVNQTALARYKQLVANL
ncbi:MAG: transcriptional regulator [Piscirickettsiaceae bacterium CG_4_9_14_3_um_filter_43_564]|nr:winged helix-turn-helix transcriptional regulator [Thiomicrospira sp.]PIQ05128.1 MAG: transcriptional regulator [Piscirickettsiaceae bacterium CG18_big_fil_WC_8_21_14_2_50_44_103]PIU37759.1 MAG: transcriptional regulator [Piscirickettsiaceae bacterium CG07_land_8_20_14_0_80_44_28]PIW58499.1 MAG: transcriptional regulator [Piscirickettsiaceae bacterium CG12_big_fil_rev_8_21_14_0_65_44_934]PIW77565.1 MAG: transcriptional regulator [Piscirickettsiaceae bacterium CG_4_8_14_3_um_filter_44_38]PIX